MTTTQLTLAYFGRAHPDLVAAIRREARDQAIEECAVMFERKSDAIVSMNTCSAAAYVRALRSSPQEAQDEREVVLHSGGKYPSVPDVTITANKSPGPVASDPPPASASDGWVRVEDGKMPQFCHTPVEVKVESCSAQIDLAGQWHIVDNGSPVLVTHWRERRELRPPKMKEKV